MQEKGQQARETEAPQPADVIKAISERMPQQVSCQRILVPTDGSGQAFKAVLDAIHLAAATGAELTLLMVVDYNKNVAAFEQVSLGGYVPAELKVAAYRFLADLMHLIPSEIRAQPRVERGIPQQLRIGLDQLQLARPPRHRAREQHHALLLVREVQYHIVDIDQRDTRDNQHGTGA